MFTMSDLSIKLQLTDKSYIFPFKDTSLDSILLNPSDIPPKQNRVEKVTFLLLALNLKIYFPSTKNITTISIIMQTQTKFLFALVKLIQLFFSGEPN